MEPSRRSEMSRALRGLSVETEQMPIDPSSVSVETEHMPIVTSTLNAVNDPAANSIVGNQHAGTHLGAPSDTIGESNLVSSSGVELQTSCLATGLATCLDHVHQLIMDIQQSQIMDFNHDLHVLPRLEEFDAAQPQESSDIGAANLQAVRISHEFGNQSTQTNRDSRRFQPYRSPGSALSRGTGNPGPSNRVDDAPFSQYGLPALLHQVGPIQLPELEPLTDAEELEMLNQLIFMNDPHQSVENANHPFTYQQLNQPHHLGAPSQTNCMASNDPSPSNSLPSPPLPFPDFINSSANQLESSSLPYGGPYGYQYQQSPQQPYADLDWDLQAMQQLVSTAAFNSFLSSEPGAIENPPSIVTPIVPDVVQFRAPAVTITPFEPSTSLAMMTQPPARNTVDPNPLTNYAELSAPVTAARGRGRAGRGRGNRLPQRRAATDGRPRRLTAIAPKTDGVPHQRINRAEITISQVAAQRQSHIWLERQRRKHINDLYATMRNLLPENVTSRKTRLDNSTVLLEMFNFITGSKNEMAMLEGELNQVQSAGRNLPAVGTSDSGLASFSGTNVAIHRLCGHNCFVTISVPDSRSDGLLERIVVTLNGHHLEVLHVTLVTRDNTKVYTIQCQASRNAEQLRNDLHAALQSVVNEFIPSSSSQGDHA